jgi:hypothetical protein
MCADTTFQEEEEKDPSDGKLGYAFDEFALLSDLSSGNSYISSFSPTTNTTGGAYNQFNQEELQSDFNITYNKEDSPPSLSPINTNTDMLSMTDLFSYLLPYPAFVLRSDSDPRLNLQCLSFVWTLIPNSTSSVCPSFGL